MKKLLLPGLTIFAALFSLFMITSPTTAALSFADPGFATTWNRTDKPLESQTDLGRGYTWGLPVSEASTVWREVYNNSARTVQYFDKARMEINANVSSDNLFYVTTGLLVKEMVTGQRQDGDNSSTNLKPSTVQIAGDPNLGSANQIAPTYASFSKVATSVGNVNGKAEALDSLINTQIDKNGNTSTFNPPEQRTIKGYDPDSQHNIADVFVDYGNQTGLIWNGSNLVQGAIFFDNPTYVLGRPITEPYWIRAVVGGIEKDVLVQLFERRVLTYTPGNPANFKVEMGNVGQHYYQWRYILSTVTPTPTATKIPTSTPVPAATAIPTATPILGIPPIPTPIQNLGSNLQISPTWNFAGNYFSVTGNGFAAYEIINLWLTDPYQNTIDPTNLSIPNWIMSDGDGNFTYYYKARSPFGTWAITAHGNISGKVKLVNFLVVDFFGPPAVVLNRTNARANDVINVNGYNFGSNESFTFWVTTPDGKIIDGTPTIAGQNASSNGQITFNYVVPTGNPGQWAISIRGVSSNRTATGYFTYP